MFSFKGSSTDLSTGAEYSRIGESIFPRTYQVTTCLGNFSVKAVVKIPQCEGRAPQFLIVKWISEEAMRSIFVHLHH